MVVKGAEYPLWKITECWPNSKYHQLLQVKEAKAKNIAN